MSLLRASGTSSVPLLAVLLALCLGLGVSGCSDNPHPPDETLRDSLDVGGDVWVLRVEVASRNGGEVIAPDSVEVPVGGMVEFVATDRFVHAVEFEADGLFPEGRDFLERSGQLGGPPLLEQGARFVVTFEEAPAGRYPFRVRGNHGTARGTVVVRAGR